MVPIDVLLSNTDKLHIHIENGENIQQTSETAALFLFV